ncbi:MAG: septum formation protein Maf [Paludibacteraceae bacterium]|jgi:septum formation protein|nr:septum formation protein Maf [Paludibacteraceae bacterium]
MAEGKLNIILGSQSPRRRELMSGLDIPYRAISIDADESYPQELEGGDIPIYISRAKARAYIAHLHDDDLLITADTIVWLNGKMLGKPHDESEAREMIRQLSGKVHQVYTGVTFTRMIDGAAVMESLVDKTDVTFRSLSEEEIAYYVENYKPLDKAGAYGVQEYIGYIGVSGMNGSYFNVMGFPIARVYEVLKRLAC